jgi:hypothetical protein
LIRQLVALFFQNAQHLKGAFLVKFPILPEAYNTWWIKALWTNNPKKIEGKFGTRWGIIGTKPEQIGKK